MAFNFSPGSTISVSATSASANAALNTSTAPNVVVSNSGSKLAYVKFGDAAVAATTADFPVLAGTQAIFSVPNLNTHVAAITVGSDTTTILASKGFGQ